MKKYLMTIIILILATIGFFAVYFFCSPENTNFKINTPNKNNTPLNIQETNSDAEKFSENNSSLEVNIPLDEALSRITKKPFGIYVNPKNSPVSPEKFTGFHTGTDFELFEEEIEKNVAVKAIADGEIIKKINISGYGGVILEKTEIEKQPVTIIYGHINLDSATKEKEIKKGDFLAFLAPDNSPGSGFERKHLHLGIIKGNIIDYRGYIQSQGELLKWIDPTEILKK